MTSREWVSRVWGTLRRHRTDGDLEDELRVHLELAADEARRRGESQESAGRTARLQVGGVAQAMEAQRDQRGLPWLEDLARDLRYAWRISQEILALRSSRSSRWRLASARTAPFSALPMRSSSGH